MILEIKNLNKAYEKNKCTPVKKINLKVPEGQFVAITGKSGSGKSTLMHLIGGLDRPTNGKVIIDGIDIYSLKFDELTIFRRNNIGFIYQFYNLIPVLTVKENIILPVALNNEKIKWKYFDKLVKKLNLKDKLNYLPNELSGGQQQRCAIARALISHPKLLLADEPTGNLDRKNSEQVIKILKHFNKAFKQTIIIVTHDEEIAKQASRIIIYEDGEIKSDKIINN